MRTRLIFVLVILFSGVSPAASQDAEDFIDRYIRFVLSREWEHKMISSGPNFPGINLQQDHRGELAILLHEGVPHSAIREHFAWSDADLRRRLDELLREGLIQPDSTRGYVPTLMVMALGDVARHLPMPEPLVEDAVRLVVSSAPEVRERYSQMDGFRHVPFEAASLLVLSNVLLDNWQINDVERQFLRAERPLRAGKQYYYSIQEKAPWRTSEAFGIYGNQYRTFGRFTVGVYGNQRNSRLNLLNLTLPELRERFGTAGPDSVHAFKELLLQHLARAARDSAHALPEPYRRGFESLGLMKEGRVIVPLLDAEDQAALSGLASVVTEDLVTLLERYRPLLMQSYRSSSYNEEITFEEYFIWWYHLFYTAVTDRLIAQGHIVRPASGISTYVFVPTSLR